MLLRSIGLILLLIGPIEFTFALQSHAAPARTKSGHDGSSFALRYVEALAHSQIDTWAAADLGCLSRVRAAAGGGSSKLTPDVSRRCWDDTLRGHTAMVTQQVESGVFSATGRGVGLGLLHDRHRATENWKDYPPAVFVSPPVILKEHAPIPRMTIVRTSSWQPLALSQIKGTDLVSLQGQAVDIKIAYPDPLTAPLALRPEEIWWVNGARRHFGPVREVVARFIVVTGLRKFGFSVDQAVMNEVLPEVPLISTTHYGLRPDNGRRFDQFDQAHRLLKGELVAGSARWWDRTNAESVIQATLDRAAHLSAAQRTGLLTRLLLIDPTHVETHELGGEDAYQDLLKQGIAKGGLAARDESALKRITELYWTIQAQTWRQELTAISEGYEPAADALYRAMASYESITEQHRATPEERRRLGVLTRWNNDPIAALNIHEALLRDTTEGTADYGIILTEVVWDRIQWVSWQRRYDHPWLQQANVEAEQAAQLLTHPYDAISAHYAQVVIESLLAPRDQDRFQQRLQQSKRDLGLIPGVKGLSGQLLANDLVKALTPEATNIVLPSPPRSLEVLDVAVHANPPKQDILWQWNFDQDQPGQVPTGFVQWNGNEDNATVWQVHIDEGAASAVHQMVRSSACSRPDCMRLLIAERVKTTYPDVTVQVRSPNVTDQSEAGIAIAVTDRNNYYAITLHQATGLVTTRRVVDGVATVLGQVSTKLSVKFWHTMRVQRINFLHLDKGRLAVFVDGTQVAAVDDAVLPKEGQVGLIAVGTAEAYFDGLHVLDLVSNQTFSKPAAY